MQVLRIVPTRSAVTLRFYLTRIMPIGLGMSLSLLFGNLVYLQLSMSFIQMLKVSGRLGQAGRAARSFRQPFEPGWSLPAALRLHWTCGWRCTLVGCSSVATAEMQQLLLHCRLSHLW